MNYTRFTQWTENGASLILDNPQNEDEARKQLMKKFKLACNKLAELEDKIELGTLKEIPENSVVLTMEEWEKYQTTQRDWNAIYFDGIEKARKETAEAEKEISNETV